MGLKNHLPPSSNRRTMVFCAVQGDEVLNKAADFLSSPEFFIKCNPVNTLPVGLNQDTWEVENELDKPRELQQALEKVPGQCVVFVRSTKRCLMVTSHVQSSGVLTGEHREGVCERFRRGEFRVLVTTDIAAQGLDFPGVTLVVNYDCPSTLNEYILRAGRTGRAGRAGTVVTFVEPTTPKAMINQLRDLHEVEDPRELPE
eukprot:NODE_3319_length_787_cov_129.903794_g2776_i0.p1 GENE.NODE_3319_length_787_cov_129.903794_g2776_i0~~NODE_3319_length_787_cov_129.903794_g2776_i0.p1  ORF type:complete len:220 (+),score=53.79 NODE_3319_length_787_cov_129.903794_g2776_i0:60-662(+)